MFKEERTDYRFKWADLGNIEEGRPNLGPTTLVSVYRLMQYTLRDVLISKYGVEAANGILVEAGKLAGSEFCLNLLNRQLGFEAFVAELQEKLKSLNVGILRVEKSNIDKMEFTLTVSEDLDCSGLPLLGETVCDYDEGFIAGILNTYTGRDFDVKEVDCWASGERTCRFHVKPKE
ncbi:MAG: 4-vinyl reductase [Desulfomonile sp.]|nr:4-vinyl reductase [Desulfomonile sp.]